MNVSNFKECEEVFDPRTGDIVEKKITGPGDFVYVPAWRCMV